MSGENAAPVLVLTPREVPLGGPRAMTVRRTLPHKDRSFVGAWCFVDHYGPHDVAATGGMDVPPHPHAGLQTVSLLFQGEIEHRDTLGTHAFVRPGAVNLMTSGRGIAHTEVSTPQTTILHGVQLWVVTPDAQREGPRVFENYDAPHVSVGEGVHLRVFIGALAGQSSPIATATPLLAAEVQLAPGARWTVAVDTAFEHAVLVDDGDVALEGVGLARGDLGVVDAGPAVVTLVAGAAPVRLVLLGGTPFEEDIVMWWNFIGRSDEDIRRMREEWMTHSERFGQVRGYEGATQHLAAPMIPDVRLRPRSRLGTR